MSLCLEKKSNRRNLILGKNSNAFKNETKRARASNSGHRFIEVASMAWIFSLSLIHLPSILPMNWSRLYLWNTVCSEPSTRTLGSGLISGRACSGSLVWSDQRKTCCPRHSVGSWTFSQLRLLHPARLLRAHRPEVRWRPRLHWYSTPQFRLPRHWHACSTGCLGRADATCNCSWAHPFPTTGAWSCPGGEGGSWTFQGAVGGRNCSEGDAGGVVATFQVAEAAGLPWILPDRGECRRGGGRHRWWEGPC